MGDFVFYIAIYLVDFIVVNAIIIDYFVEHLKFQTFCLIKLGCCD